MDEAPRSDDQGRLGLRDEEFWSGPLRTRGEVEDPLFACEAESLILDGPRRVAIDARASCPVVALRVAPIAKLGEVPFDDQAIVTAVDLAQNRAFAAAARAPVPDRRPHPKGGGPPPEGHASEAFLIDLRERLGLPWRPAEYLVTLLLREQISSRIRITLAGDHYEDPEARRYLEERRRLSPPAAIQPPPAWPVPSYRPSPSTPRIPEQPGIVLGAQRVVVIEDRAACIVHGSFRLPVREVDLVERSDGSIRAPEGAEHLDARPTAVVPITLLIVGCTWPSPRLWRLTVPSFDAIEWEGATPVATGCFTVDLASTGLIERGEETYLIHAFSGEAMGGPVPVAVVRDEAFEP